MKFLLTELSWEDYLFWQKNDKQKLKRIKFFSLFEPVGYQRILLPLDCRGVWRISN